MSAHTHVGVEAVNNLDADADTCTFQPLPLLPLHRIDHKSKIAPLARLDTRDWTSGVVPPWVPLDPPDELPLAAPGAAADGRDTSGDGVVAVQQHPDMRHRLLALASLWKGLALLHDDLLQPSEEEGKVNDLLVNEVCQALQHLSTPGMQRSRWHARVHASGSHQRKTALKNKCARRGAYSGCALP